MANHPIHGRIDGPIVMIGFGSIGKGTLPLIERHFEYDKSRFVVIDPEDKDRKLLRRARHPLHPCRRDPPELPPSPDPAAHRGRRPGLLRQPVGRHLVARHHGIVQRARRALHRYGQRAVGRLLFRHQARPRGALQLRAPRSHHEGQARPQARQHHGRVLLRREPRHGVLVRQAGAAQHRGGHQAQAQGACDPRRMGPACEEARRQGHPYRRARHPARQAAEADGDVRQHLVDRGLRVGGPAAGRARLGHAREVDAGERRTSTRPAARRRST